MDKSTFIILIFFLPLGLWLLSKPWTPVSLSMNGYFNINKDFRLQLQVQEMPWFFSRNQLLTFLLVPMVCLNVASVSLPPGCTRELVVHSLPVQTACLVTSKPNSIWELFPLNVSTLHVRSLYIGMKSQWDSLSHERNLTTDSWRIQMRMNCPKPVPAVIIFIDWTPCRPWKTWRDKQPKILLPSGKTSFSLIIVVIVIDKKIFSRRKGFAIQRKENQTANMLFPFTSNSFTLLSRTFLQVPDETWETSMRERLQ